MRISASVNAAFITLTAAACTAWAGDLTWAATKLSLTAPAAQEQVQAAFHFRNSGQKVVVITDIETSCDCAVAVSDKRILSPGEEGDVKVTFRFGNSTGRQQKLIYVRTDDVPAQPTTLNLQVDIIELFHIEPHLLVWKMGATPTIEKTVTVTAGLGQEITIADFASDNPGFETRLVTVSPGQRFELFVRPNALTKQSRAILKLQIEDAQGKHHSASVYALIQ